MGFPNGAGGALRGVYVIIWFTTIISWENRQMKEAKEM